MRLRNQAQAGAALALALATLAACSSDSTGPGSPVRFARVLTLPQFDSALGTGPTRVEISVLPGGLVARQIEIEPEDREEKITSRVTALDDAAGTVTLELGGMTISYNAGTRFRTPQSSRASRAAWVAAVQAALDRGDLPPIEARRNPPATPQAPDDPSFTALDLRLEADLDEAKIEVFVDRDNLAPVATPPPLAILTVFGLPIEITANTDLKGPGEDQIPPAGAVEFEAGVVAVDPAGGSFTLSGGTVIRVSGATVFDPDGDLFSLDAMAAAVSGNRPVRAEGHGSVESAGPPPTILATDVKVEVDD